MKETSISLFRLVETLKSKALHSFDEKLAVGNMFFSPKALPYTYIEPPFSIQYKTENESEKFENVDVILIAATGATGKSALSHYMAYTLEQPIFDMGAAGPVGANSLIGILNKNGAINEMVAFMKDIKDGHSFIIIDALDEGLLKVTSLAFNSFLDDIVNLSKDAVNIPFVLTGRSTVMENVAIELENKGLRVMVLQIEPFTIEKAREFIDVNITKKEHKEKFNDAYDQVCNLILSSVEGFFKDIKEMKDKQYERFIGYAPVLQTIAKLLDEKCNYQQLYNELIEQNVKNINLIIDIIERIMIREQKKVRDELLPQITEDINPETREVAYTRAYSIPEQCFRLLYAVLEIETEYDITDDSVFNERYSEKIKTWVQEHPFYNNVSKNFINVVFEAYVIVQAIKNTECKEIAMLYLHDFKYKISYLLFDFYEKFNPANEVSSNLDIEITPFLYESLCAMDSKNDRVGLEIINRDERSFELSFFRKNAEYTYVIDCGEKEIKLPIFCSNIVIDAPIKVLLSSRTKIDMKAPIFLSCDKIIFDAPELGLYPSEKDESIIWETDGLDVRLSTGNIPHIYNYLQTTGANFNVLTKKTLSYPFVQYQTSALSTVDKFKINYEYYQKLRRTLLMFRSHSKGVLARLKDKINNRIGSTRVGKSIIESLLSMGIMYESGVKYYINYDQLANVLGVKYDDIQSSVVNEKIVEFLKLTEQNVLKD